MLLDIIKAFIVGICASAPLGPIAILVIQKSLSGGHKAGFIAGLGASVVDTVFAVAAIFALAVVQDFVYTHQNLILIVGGLVVAIIGVSMSFSDPFRKVNKTSKSSVTFADFLQSLVMGFSNPGAIFVILALFALFGLADEAPQTWNVMPIILSVSAGTVVYWFFVTWLLSRFRKKFEIRTILWINRVAGAIIIVIGIALLGEGIFNVFFR
jgi:threonine/homoserine/homoserine lactone efflux protein